MSIVLAGSTSGTITLQEPAVAGTNTLSLPAATGTVALTSQLPVAGPAFSAFQSSSQSITSATWTKVQFQTEEFDTNSNFDSATNFRFTPTVAGYYQIDAAITGSSQTSIYFGIQIYKNGTGFKYGTFYSCSGINPTSVISSLISMNGSTDYLEIYLITASNSSISAGANTAYFQGFLARTA